MKINDLYTENGMPPLEIPKAIFDGHYAYYSNVGIETIKQQSGQAEQISADYEGRVIYELLQNAFDKATSRVLVKVEGNTLYVANDGDRFTYTVGYVYSDVDSARYRDAGELLPKRGDFQALCSISTSNKDANESIGNKGVGFKSVFSIAAQGYVDILTDGRLIASDSFDLDGADVQIGFRVYDSFDDPNALPLELPHEVFSALKRKIEFAQQERADRGVPGYYFPIQLDLKRQEGLKLITDEKFVTVVKVPIAPDKLQDVEQLIKDIEKFHFRFVSLLGKKIKVHFEFRGQRSFAFSPPLRVEGHRGRFASHDLGDQLRSIALAAKITITSPKVAIYLRSEAEAPGKLYNYLPTEVDSPFPFVDFHADFQTTINRKTINFDGDVGAYNKALLRACLELLFCHLSLIDPRRLKTIYVKAIQMNNQLRDFKWQWLQSKRQWPSYEMVRSIFQIEDYSYYAATEYLSTLAKSFFELKPRAKNEHRAFFEAVEQFASHFAVGPNQYDMWVDRFLRALKHPLVDKAARIIPNESRDELGIPLFDEIYIKDGKAGGSRVFVPDFVGITISNFNGIPQRFRDALGLKAYSNRQEVLKYFRQVSPSGQYNQVIRLSEADQRKLLASIASFPFESTAKVNSAYRYDDFIFRQPGSDNSSANFSDFALSTVFLKTTNGRYKPSQLCHSSELDISFLPDSLEADQIAHFLRLLGVSFHSTYLFVDIPFDDQLVEGLDYIPGLWRQESGKLAPLKRSEILRQIRIVRQRDEVHPALINENYRRFLYDISDTEIRNELGSLRVKDYDFWPKEYAEILYNELKGQVQITDEMISLYAHLVDSFRLRLNKYLLIHGNTLQFSDSTDFFVAKDKIEFDFLRTFDITLLAAHRGRRSLEWAQDKFIRYREGDVVALNPISVSAEIKAIVSERMVYLLSGILKFASSERDYLGTKRHVLELQQRLSELNFFEAENVRQTMMIGVSEVKYVKERQYALDSRENALYFNQSCSKSAKAEALAKHLFMIPSASNIIELNLFRKELDELRAESSTEEIDALQRAWDPAYEVKYKLFLNETFAQLGMEPPNNSDKWYIHNTSHPSILLCEIAKQGRFVQLIQAIERSKQGYDGLFATFEIQVGKEYIPRIMAMIDVLENSKSARRKTEIGKLRKLLSIPFLVMELDDLENSIKAKFPGLFTVNPAIKEEGSSEPPRRDEQELVDLLVAIDGIPPTEEHFLPLDGESSLHSIPSRIDPKIHHSTADDSDRTATNKETGKKGELRVLGHYINAIIGLGRKERRMAIKSMSKELSRKLSKTAANITYLDAATSKCLQALDEDTSLRIFLIELMYVARRFPKSYFDLIGYKSGQVRFVEVKATGGNPTERDSFPISLSEVDAARIEERYEIVRVTPTAIYFLGNPFWNKEDQFKEIHSSRYVIKPSGYLFEYRLNSGSPPHR